jgi:hypothetical protein
MKAATKAAKAATKSGVVAAAATTKKDDPTGSATAVRGIATEQRKALAYLATSMKRTLSDDLGDHEENSIRAALVDLLASTVELEEEADAIMCEERALSGAVQ